MIERSVGAGGVNDHNDALIIQCALNVDRFRQGVAGIAMDGLVGPVTVAAIVAFQRTHYPLAQDGRIDAGGRTLAALTTAIGGEEFVFGPAVQELLAIHAEFLELSRIAPDSVRRPITQIVPRLDVVREFSDLAEGLPPAKTPPSAVFNRRTPNFGFVGADDLAAAMALAMLALIMALMLVLIIQSPVFRKAVKVRAKELDRIMGELRIHASVGLKDSVDIIQAVFTDTKEEEQRCRESPTFTRTPQCEEAMREFARIAAELQALLPRLIRLVTTIIDNVKFPNRGLDIRKIRIDFNALLAKAQSLAFDLQMALAAMREACNCPDE